MSHRLSDRRYLITGAARGIGLGKVAQPLRVAVMDRQGAPGVKFDVEGSGFGFRVIKTISQTGAEQPHSCQMNRPS